MKHIALVILCALALAAAVVCGQEASDGTFEAGNYFVNLNYPKFSLHAKFKNGSVYNEQYIHLSLDAVEEGTTQVIDDVFTFNATKSYSQDDLRSNFTVSKLTEIVSLSGGNVTATREVLHTHCILPNGANVTLRFEVYDRDGTIDLGTNTVHIRANRIKYTAMINDWIFDAPNHRVRLMITGKYVSGPYESTTPSVLPLDWFGPARHVQITWPSSGPLNEAVLDVDIWALADDSVSNIALAPNPLRENSTTDTLGLVLPPFSRTITWDPNVLISLFSEDPTQPGVKRSNFDRNRNIIIGCVVGGVALIVASIIIGFIIFKKKSSLRTRSMFAGDT